MIHHILNSLFARNMGEHDKDASECRSNYRGDQVFDCGMMFDSEVWYEYRHSNTFKAIQACE